MTAHRSGAAGEGRGLGERVRFDYQEIPQGNLHLYDKTVLYRNCGDSNITVCIFQNSQNCTPKKVKFTVCY